MSIKSQLSFDEITSENAKADVKSVLVEAEKRIGYVPNIYGMMANSSGSLEAYTSGDKSFRTKSLLLNIIKPNKLGRFSGKMNQLLPLSLSKLVHGINRLQNDAVTGE